MELQMMNCVVQREFKCIMQAVCNEMSFVVLHLSYQEVLKQNVV